MDSFFVQCLPELSEQLKSNCLGLLGRNCKYSLNCDIIFYQLDTILRLQSVLPKSILYVFPRIQPRSLIEPVLELNPGQLTHPN